MPVLKFDPMSTTSLRVRKMLAASINVFAKLTLMPVPKIPPRLAVTSVGRGGAPGPPGTGGGSAPPGGGTASPWRRRGGRLGHPLRRLQIVELFLEAVDLCLVLPLD